MCISSKIFLLSISKGLTSIYSVLPFLLPPRKRDLPWRDPPHHLCSSQSHLLTGYLGPCSSTGLFSLSILLSPYTQLIHPVLPHSGPHARWEGSAPFLKLISYVSTTSLSPKTWYQLPPRHLSNPNLSSHR